MKDAKAKLAAKAASPETQEAVMARRLLAGYRAWVEAGRPARVQGN